MKPALRAPAYRITWEGTDITDKVDPRLIDLSIEECRGDQVDQLDLTLSDHDGKLAMPSKGALLSVAIGWAGEALIDKGSFKVDEVEHRGAPDSITVRARSADLNSGIKTRAERSYHDTTLGSIVKQIAARNKLKPRIDAKLAARAIAHIDQTESDVAFLTRLGKQHDAVSTIKAGTLLFLPVMGTTTSTGKALQVITLSRGDGDQHRYATADRQAYSGVRAYWHDAKKANRRSVLVGQSGNAKRLRESYASEADARDAALAEWRRIQRGAATFDITLAEGVPTLSPQTPVRLRGWKEPIGSIDWLTVKVRHQLSDSGFTTQASLEVAGADASEGSIAS